MTADGTAAAQAQARVQRPSLDDLDLSPGKRARLHRILYEHGLGNGTLMALPVDQGLEHGPGDFLVNPPSADPEFQWRLAVEGNYNAIACHYGFARKYMRAYAGRVPLILKLNGKTNIPSDADALSTLVTTVEEAVALGADAVGYTLYVGSPRQDEDFVQFQGVRRECERFGMPLIVWSYPRGSAIEDKGGKNSLYAVDYAARLAMELGADVVKLNIPGQGPKDDDQPAGYAGIDYDYGEGARRVVNTAGRTLALFSGGSKLSDEDLLRKARTAMEAGATGLIFGRNMWQRPYEEALEMTGRIRDVLKDFPS